MANFYPSSHFYKGLSNNQASVEVRRGDRKVGVEIISNMDYWNYIPKSDQEVY